MAGRPQAYAVAVALAVVSAVDGDESRALERLEQGFYGMPGRTRLIEGIKRSWLIDDSYNSSPLAALSALRDLAAFPVQEGCHRIAALGDMLELGSLAESSHQEVGRAVAQNKIDLLVACGAFASIVAESAIAAGMPRDHVFTFPESREAGLFIQNRMKKGDVVLIKGSQGSRMERISKELMAHPEKAEELLVRHTKEWVEKE
jgi:UDP-N-acetylmuramoyl-tripeptide--D-alanyl-D-alanine ligase